MKVLVTGGGGQLAACLLQCRPEGAEAIAVSRRDLDVRDAGAVDACLEAARPDAVVNAAAFTDVDAAEARRVEAWDTNAAGAGNVARACARLGCRLIHLSTDYVFDGRGEVARQPGDPVHPLGAYGASKAAGERQVLAAGPGRALVVRTAWLFRGSGRGYVPSMARAFAEGRTVRAATDQRGTPTRCDDLARALWTMAGGDATGIVHWVGAGTASRVEWAGEILAICRRLGRAAEGAGVQPVTMDELGLRAVRPAWSVLDGVSGWALTGGRPPPWQERLEAALREG